MYDDLQPTEYTYFQFHLLEIQYSDLRNFINYIQSVMLLICYRISQNTARKGITMPILFIA